MLYIFKSNFVCVGQDTKMETSSNKAAALQDNNVTRILWDPLMIKVWIGNDSQPLVSAEI